MRKWILPLAILLVVPALGAAAPISTLQSPEQLVEGHTVFTVLEQVTPADDPTGRANLYGAAVAVLVREYQYDTPPGAFFPGVLWFNDQYLVNPSDADQAPAENLYRYPCKGAVLAVPSGSPLDPVGNVAFDNGVPATGVEYIESYYITDPNDYYWYVDKWNWTSGTTTVPIWTVAIMGNDAQIHLEDEETDNCYPVDEGDNANIGCPGNRGNLDFGTVNPLTPPTAQNYRDEHVLPVKTIRCNDQAYTSSGTSAKYNALLFFYLHHFEYAGYQPSGTRDHTDPDNSGDVSGCHATAEGEWACPNGDDAEGNSHPYNPYEGLGRCVNCVSTGGHGGTGANANIHNTYDITVYYGTAADPRTLTANAERNVVLWDYEGSTAPFHCHTGMTCHNDLGLPYHNPNGGGTAGYETGSGGTQPGNPS